jgi:hypothetical protein
MEEKLQNQQRNKLEVFFGGVMLIRPPNDASPNVCSWMMCPLDNLFPYEPSLQVACMRPRVGTHQLGTHRPRDRKYKGGIVHEQTFGDTLFEDVFIFVC